MKGQHFAHVSPDPKIPGRMLIKTGVVVSAVGPENWLLSFQAKGYRFANVFSAANLANFAFFDSPAERDLFIGELMATQPLTEAPPAPAEAP